MDNKIKHTRIRSAVVLILALSLVVSLFAPLCLSRVEAKDQEITPPTPITGLIYNGQEQELVTAGSAGDKELEYQLNYNAYYSKWSKDIPKGLHALNYKIYYRIEGEEEAAGYVENRMEPLEVTVTADEQYSVKGAELNELTYKIEGLAPGDTEADLGLVEPWTDADKYTPGTYTVYIRMNDTCISYVVNEVNAPYHVMNAILTVDFDSDGGSKVEPITYLDIGDHIEKPADPVKDGYTFAGWYYQDKQFDFSLPIIKSFTLKAKWTKNETPDDKGDDKGDDKKDDPDKKDVKPSNEWVDGQWYDADGKTDYAPKGSWKQNESGWWYEDTDGWYPKSQWQKIDGKWYYFLSDGYMDYSEYRDGYWLGADGAWDEAYYGGHWVQDSIGWWYEDATGWYPQNQYLWIDGVQYWFGSDGRI